MALTRGVKGTSAPTRSTSQKRSKRRSNKTPSKEFVCPQCGNKFLRKFVYVPLCYSCQEDNRLRGGLSKKEKGEIREAKRLEKEAVVQKRLQESREIQNDIWREKLNVIMRMKNERKMSYVSIAMEFGVSRQEISQFIERHKHLL